MRRAVACLGVLGGLGLPALAIADCPATTADLLDAVERAESAWVALDEPGFLTATDEMRAVLPCVSDPIPRALAAAVHRGEGLRAAADGEQERAVCAFAAAREAEPAWRFPEGLLPPGHPLLALYNEPVDAAPLPLPPGGGTVRVDGQVAEAVPDGRAAIIQVFGDDGGVLTTVYHWPEQPLPERPAMAFDPVTYDHLGSMRLPPEPRPWGWLVAGGAGAVATGVLYGLAASSAHRYEDPDTHPAALDLLQRRANGLVVASGATGLVSVSLLVVGAVRW